MTDPLSPELIREGLEGCDWSEIVVPGQPGAFAPTPAAVESRVRGELARLGIEELFSHQAEAVESLLAGKDTMLVTGTSSGKTLAYALPALQMLQEEPAARALLIYPTKALAQDQLGKLRQLAGENGPMAAVYDGDTPKGQRAAIRNEAQLVLTNPDMLHIGILPSHELWRKFLRSLRLIVIDEAHTLRGVFGSHAAWVFRRLLRLCEWYGSRPVVCAASATVPNGEALFENLTGRKPFLVQGDGSPKAPKSLLLAPPPPPDDPKAVSPNTLSASLLAGLAIEGVRTLCFCRSRNSAELVVRQARRRIKELGGEEAWVDSYRSGYTAKERRAIESAFFKGKLRGLASTNAMELGVDVGGLDAVIINGYPGSIASFWQQAGRTGRSGRSGAIVYIPHEDALEHHLLRCPELLFAGTEPATVTLSNQAILDSQLPCAAYERPILPEELPPAAQTAAKSLVESGVFAFSAGRFFLASHNSPAGKVSIRGASEGTVQLVNAGEVIGEMEEWRALQNAHPGAVYLHREATFLVDKLDWPSRTAFLSRSEPPYYTMPVVQSLAEEKMRVSSESVGAFSMGLASLEVTASTMGFVRMAVNGGHVLSEEPLSLPPYSFQTLGAVLDVPSELCPLDDERSPGVLHALEHCLCSAGPLVAGCDPRDLHSGWFLVSPDTFAPRIIVYDAVPGGIGLSEELVRSWRQWVGQAWLMASSCSCEEGCPRCIMSSRCESGNQPLDKPGVLALLKLILTQA